MVDDYDGIASLRGLILTIFFPLSFFVASRTTAAAALSLFSSKGTNEEDLASILLEKGKGVQSKTVKKSKEKWADLIRFGNRFHASPRPTHSP